jgi:DNA-binding XRE family transcriptional regulator
VAKAKINGHILRNMRKEAGMTQRDLAQRLGISRETVIAIEKNKVGTIESIEAEVLSNWWLVLHNQPSVSEETKMEFGDMINKLFKKLFKL